MTPAPLLPVVFAVRECVCGFILTATSSAAVTAAWQAHQAYSGHTTVRAASVGPSTDRLTFRASRNG